MTERRTRERRAEPRGSAGILRPADDVLRVLLCEDNPVDAIVVTELLRAVSKDRPMQVTRAESLADALDGHTLRAFDVVLLDLALPDSSGMATLERFLDVDRDAAIVVLTAADDDAMGETAVRLGAQDYVTKDGLTGSALRRVVRYAYGRKAAVRQSEERYRRIIEGALDAVVTTDVAGLIVDWNPRAEALLGWTRAEVVGRRLAETVFPGRAEDADALAFLAPADALPALNAVRETLVRRRDGTDIAVEVAVSVTGSNGNRLFTSFIRDITGRRRAEEQLRAEKAFADALIDNMPGAFALLDDAGRILRWNQALESALEYAPDDIAGEVVLRFVRKDDHAKAAAAIAAAFRTGSSAAEIRLLKKRGGQVPFYVTGASIWWNGKPCLVITGVDLSERREMESQLVHAQKMESIGRLAGGVAHDFNNMLAAVLSFSELILMDSPPDDPRRADVETIREAAMRATGLTRQLLAFSRRQVFSLKVVDLNQLIAGLDRMLRRVIGEEFELATLFGERLGLVEVDPGQIESAIVNLAVNARDAMSAGGQLTLETSNVELSARPAEPGALTGPAVRLTVTDSGSGMTEDVLRHVFEPFFTTKEPGKGTGLGLPSVYGIVKQSRGQIGVTSTPGQGTVFTIDLPRVPPAAAGGADAVEAGVTGGTETIIVAEDNDLVRRGITAMLTSKGYTILPAVCGEDAVRLAEQHEGPVHLLLADVVMPRMSAQELCANVHAARPDARVLFMSGYASESMESLPPFAQAFIQKPFTSELLTRKVRAVLDQPRATT